MLVIGLCGGSGSGKNLVQAAFAACGIPGIDCDAVYREMTAGPSPCMEALTAAFGPSVRTSGGSLNRTAMAELVFGEGEEKAARRAELNRITHRMVLEECRRFLKEAEKSGAQAAVINAPLLFESGFDRECDVTVAVVCDRKLQLSRIAARDGISTEAAKERLNAQADDAFLRARADHLIENNGTVAELREKAEAVAKNILKSR